jgi:hypothetical protein
MYDKLIWDLISKRKHDNHKQNLAKLEPGYNPDEAKKEAEALGKTYKKIIWELLSIRRHNNHKQNLARLQRGYDKDKEAETFEKMINAGMMDVSYHNNGLGTSNAGPKKLFVLFEILKENGYSYEDFYKLNKYGFRSDEFTSDHDGKHIVFAGCSYTYGDSVFLEDSWTYKLYLDIAKKEKLSGYFNLGSPGASTKESIDQIFFYIELFGNPEVIFLLMPNPERGSQDNSYSELFLSTNKLIEHCQNNNIKLFLSSWDLREHWDGDEDPKPKILGYSNMDIDKMSSHVAEFCENNKDHDLSKFFLYAFDLEHPGIALHDYYKKFFYDLYLRTYSEK